MRTKCAQKLQQPHHRLTTKHPFALGLATDQLIDPFLIKNSTMTIYDMTLTLERFWELNNETGDNLSNIEQWKGL